MTSCLVIAATILLGLLGFALLGYFTRFPGAMRAGMTIRKDADILFPCFIAHRLPTGLAGLLVSGALAAAMSSIDSGVNSIAAVLTRDILPRLALRPGIDPDRAPSRRFFGLGHLIANNPGQDPGIQQPESQERRKPTKPPIPGF